MIICTAISVKFDRTGKTTEAIIPGLRHSNCWELMVVPGVPADREESEGFLCDHNGQFLDRWDAFSHALLCSQLSDTTKRYKAAQGERQLFSEDIY